MHIRTLYALIRLFVLPVTAGLPWGKPCYPLAIAFLCTALLPGGASGLDSLSRASPVLLLCGRYKLGICWCTGGWGTSSDTAALQALVKGLAFKVNLRTLADLRAIRPENAKPQIRGKSWHRPGSWRGEAWVVCLSWGASLTSE